MINLKATTCGEGLMLGSHPLISTGDENEIKLQVVFDESWDFENADFFASFFTESPDMTYDVLLDEERSCMIPNPVVAKGVETFFFGVWAETRDGSRLKTSIRIGVDLLPGIYGTNSAAAENYPVTIRQNGATFVPSVVDGILYWTNDKNLPNPEPVRLDPVFVGNPSELPQGARICINPNGKKAPLLRYDEQTLTDEEKLQVRKNLGINSGGGEGIEYVAGNGILIENGTISVNDEHIYDFVYENSKEIVDEKLSLIELIYADGTFSIAKYEDSVPQRIEGNKPFAFKCVKNDETRIYSVVSVKPNVIAVYYNGTEAEILSFSSTGAITSEVVTIGQGGEDGISPIIEIEAIEGGHRVTITDAEGVKTFDILNGEDAVPLTVVDGKESTEDGGLNIYTLSDGTTLTIHNGSKGSKGDSYVLTDTDKTEIAEIAAGLIDTELSTLIGNGVLE